MEGIELKEDLLLTRQMLPKSASLVITPKEPDLDEFFRVEVLARGPEASLDVGAVVLVHKQAGNYFSNGGKKYRIITEKAVKAVLPAEEYVPFEEVAERRGFVEVGKA